MKGGRLGGAEFVDEFGDEGAALGVALVGDDEVDHEFVVEGSRGGGELGVDFVDLVGEVGEGLAERGFV